MADLEFTGERAVPGKIEPQLEFEHLSRYHFAAQWVAGKTVVDFGSGAGYGAGLLRQAGAERVVGVDIAPDANHFARSTYGGEGVSFVTGDCTRACLRAGWADVVTAFEIVEHVEDYRGLLATARDLLGERGLLVISTPNKKVYSDERQAPQNPFHVKEFYCDEFRELLAQFFPQVLMLGQATTEGMLFSPLDRESRLTANLTDEAKGDDFADTTDFLVAICGFGEEVALAGRQSQFMASSGNEIRRRTRMINALQAELEDRTRWAKSLDARVSEQRTAMSHQEEQLAGRNEELSSKTRRVSDLESELIERTRETAAMEEAAEQSRRQVTELRSRLEERLRIARKLKREVAERDRQFLERLRDLERLDTSLQEVQALQESSQDLQALLVARLEAAGEALADVEDRQEGQQALLDWHRDSLLEQARQVDASREMEDRLARLTTELEAASYQHQLGLDHHSHQFTHVFEQLEAVRQDALGQATALEHHRARELDLRQRLESRPWRGDSGWSRFWNRLRGRASPEEVEAEATVSEVLQGLASSDDPRLTVVVPVRLDLATVKDSLSALARSTAGVDYEVLVLGAGVSTAVERALHRHPAVRYVQVASVGDFLVKASKHARAEHVLVLGAGVLMSPDAIGHLFESFSLLERPGVVGPRLMTLDESHQVAFGGARDEAGQPYCLGQVTDWEEVDYSYAQEAPFVPGACFMVQRSLLSRISAVAEDTTGTLEGAARLGDRIRAAGFRVYVQSRARASCAEHLVAAYTEPSEAVEADIAAPPSALDQEGPRILIVDHRLPTPDQDSGSLRMSHFLNILREHGCRLTFIPADGLPIDPYCDELQGQGIEVVVRPWVVSAFDFITENSDRFDAAIVCRSDVADRFMDPVCEALAGKPVIFDTVDLQYLREQRRAELENDAERAAEAAKTRERELATARRASSVLVVSDFEAGLLAEELPGVDVRLVSNIHHVPGTERGFAERQDLYFVGGFEHQPNVDAVKWLVESILPFVSSQLPDVKTYIIGSKPTAEVRALASDTVIVKGFVPDLEPYLEGCRLSLAPLRYGAGVKGKVNQSLAFGVPCVMTDIAAEGMGLQHGVDAMVAETAEEFAQAVVQLYSKPRLWRRLSRNGIRNTRERFSLDVARNAVRGMLSEVGLLDSESRNDRTES